MALPAPLGLSWEREEQGIFLLSWIGRHSPRLLLLYGPFGRHCKVGLVRKAVGRLSGRPSKVEAYDKPRRAERVA